MIGDSREFYSSWESVYNNSRKRKCNDAYYFNNKKSCGNRQITTESSSQSLILKNLIKLEDFVIIKTLGKLKQPN